MNVKIIYQLVKMSNTQRNVDNTQRNDNGKLYNVQKQLSNLKKHLHSPKTDLMVKDNVFIIRMELPVRDFSWELKDEQILLVSFDKQQDFLSEVTTIYSETKYGKSMRRVKFPNKVHSKPVRNNWENGIWIVEFEKVNEETAKDPSQIETKCSLEPIPEENLEACNWADM
jgi:HSP20 family molecular chaperone IbpA